MLVEEEAVVSADAIFYLLHVIAGEGAHGEEPKFFFDAFGGIELDEVFDDFPKLLFGWIFTQLLFECAVLFGECAHVCCCLRLGKDGKTERPKVRKTESREDRKCQAHPIHDSSFAASFIFEGPGGGSYLPGKAVRIFPFASVKTVRLFVLFPYWSYPIMVSHSSIR